MYENLKAKKLLVVGADVNDIEIVKVAQSMGIHTIAMDRSTDYSKSPAKLIADEAWDINYRDIDAVVERCMAMHIDGVIAGYSEMRVLLAAKIAKRLGIPFYTTEEIMELTRCKRTFKELCVKYGVPVPQEFSMNGHPNEDDLSSIPFPVIVKPTDYGGRIGITICENRDELRPAIEKALSVSESKTVVIEEYIVGTEMCAVYNLVDGEIELALLNDKYQVVNHGRSTTLCNATIVPSKHLASFLKNVDEPIKNFLRGIGARDGVAFFQMIVGETGIKVFEMGYRLNGGNDFHIIERFNNINHMKMLISHSLTGSMGDDIRKNNPEFQKTIATFIFYVHAGTVASVECDRLKEFPEVLAVTQKVFPGNVIQDDETTRQQALVVKLHANTMDEIVKLIHKIQSMVEIRDTQGKSMLFDAFDTERLREK